MCDVTERRSCVTLLRQPGRRIASRFCAFQCVDHFLPGIYRNRSARWTRYDELAGNCIGQETDRKTVEVRAVVIEDHAVIACEQVSRCALPIGFEQ